MLTLPAAGLLKERHPGCRITFLGRGYTRPVLEACEHVDAFLDWDALAGLPADEARAALAALDVDTFVHVHPRREVARLAAGAGVPHRIGTWARWYHWIPCNRLVRLDRRDSDLHEAQLNVKLLEPLGVAGSFTRDDLAARYGLTCVQPLAEGVKVLLDASRANIILHPGSGGSAREWGVHNFTALLECLPSDRYNLFVTGSAAEGTRLRPFLAAHPRLHDLTGDLDLGQLISFIRAADGLVAASTGPLHLAAALGRRAIGLFAPRRPIHPGRWAPLGPRATHLVLDEDCEACLKARECACIERIPPERVREALEAA